MAAFACGMSGPVVPMAIAPVGAVGMPLPKRPVIFRDHASRFFSGMYNTFHIKMHDGELSLSPNQLLRMLSEYGHDHDVVLTISAAKAFLKKTHMLCRDKRTRYIFDLFMLHARMVQNGVYDSDIRLPERSEDYNNLTGAIANVETKRVIDPEFAFFISFVNTYLRVLERYYDSFEKAEMESMLREYVSRGGAEVSFERVERYLELLDGDGIEYAVKDGKAWAYIYYELLFRCLSSMVGFDAQLYLPSGIPEYGQRRRDKNRKLIMPGILVRQW